MSTAAAPMFVPNLAARRRAGWVFAGVCLLITLGAMSALAVMIAAVARIGWAALTPQLLANMPSTLNPESAGMNSAIWGSLWLLVLTGLISVPVGVGAAIYLEEFARDNRVTRFIKLNIANLAGVPSIVYGILGLALFVRWLHLDRSVISGALTMSLLVLPVIIIAAREALAAVPDSIRQAAYGLGATRWQTVRHHVLPAALPGILTGVILSLSRAIGETAPLIMIGALTYVAFTPGGSLIHDYPHTPQGLWEWTTTALTDPFTAMPIQIYDWASRPQPEFHRLAAAGILVLLAVLLSMNALAVALRAWKQRSGA
ncbi:MAG: phosphate ABC transporter permease PstA [Planctomycetota bacterium]|nr:MAG: phosphate ABC transporter permease PstA [Planctomycetota bacterium]